MIYRVDGTVVPESLDECNMTLCVNSLPCDFRINGDYIFDPAAPYEHKHRLDCYYARLCKSDTFGPYDGITYQYTHRDTCPAKRLLASSEPYIVAIEDFIDAPEW